MGVGGNPAASRPGTVILDQDCLPKGHRKGDTMHLPGKRTIVRASIIGTLLAAGIVQAFAGGAKEPQAAPSGRPAPANPRVRLATTTSTENSGLLAYILPIFTAETGYTVDVVAVGTGAAIKLGENADADVLLVHARALEDAYMKAGHGGERRDVMYNDFVVVGPKADPAGLKGSSDAKAAFAKIAAAQSPFVTRGDKSGTHVMELSVWKGAGVTPVGSWYKEAGQGMEQCIIMADGMQGYTLADRATWVAVKDKTSLAISYEGDPGLFNPYGVITVNPAKNTAINAFGAKAFLEWVTSKHGQELIASFKLGGQTMFFPNYKR
jgi:tungstate transport system substrate-binding protein